MILTRTPFYSTRTHPNNFVTSVDFEITIGTGATSSITTLKQYDITKLRYGTQEGTLFGYSQIDISPYIRDYYTFSPFTLSGYTSPTVITSSAKSLLLVKVQPNPVDSLNSTFVTSPSTYIATDGYWKFTDGYNQETDQKILLSQTEYKADYRGHFIVPLFCESGDANPTVNDVEVNLGFTDNYQHYIKYLVIPCANYSGTAEVAFEGETILIEMVEECKYDVKEVQFINRYGCQEVMHFYKVKKDSLSFDFDSFKRNLLGTSGTGYATTSHQMKQYNKTANKTFNMETGHLYETYNETIEELCLSENVWMDRQPVNVKSKSLDLKTRIVDKLISYNLDFEYAFDQLNNV